MNSVCHRIADLVVRTEHDMPIPRLDEPPFNLFEVPGTTPHDLLLQFFHLPEKKAERPDLDRLPLSEELNRIIRQPIADALLNQSRSGRFIRLDGAQVLIRDYRRRVLTSILHSSVNGHPPGVHLAANMRLHVATMLAPFDAVSVHSAGIVRGGRALLMVAPDNGGKSTAAQLPHGCPVLHDDQVVIRQREGVITAHATPFGRLTDGPRSAELGAFFVLEKAPTFSIEPLGRLEMLLCLWNGHLVAHAELPAEQKTRVFDLMRAACSQAPAFVMRFPKDFIDWAAVDRAVGAP